MTGPSDPARPARKRMWLPARLRTWLPAGLSGLLLAVGAAWLGAAEGWRQVACWLLGAAFGLVLYLAGFSFAGGFRQLLGQRRGRMVRAQLLMLALATLLILPPVALGGVFGLPARGLVFPTGAATLAGAFLFGIGMQLGGGCGSGTLYAAGAGSPRMWMTLLWFIAGATLAAWLAGYWSFWPAFRPVALAAEFGLVPALAGTLAVLGAAYALVLAVERRAHGNPTPLGGARALVWAAVALAVLNLATVLVVGRPWAITAAFPLLGARAVEALGWDDPAFWPYWEDPTRTEALLRPLRADRTLVMDAGMLAGAALAATLAAGRFAGLARPSAGAAAASCIGGLLLGVGAVMGSGCNISAWVGGTASGSLHGWAWILPALAGNALGMKLRPLFRLDGMSRP